MVVLLIIVAVGLFFGSVAAAQEAKPIKIGVSFGQNVHPFFVAMQLGIEAACKELGITDYTILSADSVLETQVSQIENLVSMGSDVILLNPYDSDGVVNAVRSAYYEIGRASCRERV